VLRDFTVKEPSGTTAPPQRLPWPSFNVPPSYTVYHSPVTVGTSFTESSNGLHNEHVDGCATVSRRKTAFRLPDYNLLKMTQPITVGQRMAFWQTAFGVRKLRSLSFTPVSWYSDPHQTTLAAVDQLLLPGGTTLRWQYGDTSLQRITQHLHAADGL
jgi:hypothetical protein